ncbi:E4 ORFB [bat adenovirus 3]|uniref:E4 ORFB n=1 Tax=bat adenovirus 3 TaxID=2758098 RepID=D3X7D6_9ADEN|nr:E4 ORFB [bat adenovirus 3]ADD17125.1 E4 ORFB [bat adenovirus 3]
MASSPARYFYECHLTVKNDLAALLRDRDQETDLCRCVSTFLFTGFNLVAVRRLSSHSGSCIVSSIVFTSTHEMSTALKIEVESLIKVYVRGWLEGLGCGINEDLHSMWLNHIKVHFFSC